MNNNQRLLIDCCNNSGFSDMDLMESASNNGNVRFRGKFQEANAVNKNKRTYPFEVLDENMKRLKEAVEGRGLVGELDHPTDSVIHFANASHVVTKLWWEGNVLMGEGEILNTPHGKVLSALINDGVKVGISSRGVGNGSTNEEGIMVIGESYKLITFDAVADPSTFSAFQEKIVGPTKEHTNPSRGSVSQVVEKDSQFINSSPKNESTSIDKVSKETLIAYLGGIVKSQINN